MTHRQKGTHYHNFYRKDVNAVKFPRIKGNQFKNNGEYSKIQGGKYFSSEPTVLYHEDQKLKNEIKELQQYLKRQSDEHAHDIELLENLSDDVIELQTQNIQILTEENLKYKRQIDALEENLNIKNNKTDDEKEVWIKESSKLISYLENEFERSLGKIKAINREKDNLEEKMGTVTETLKNQLEQCALKIKELEKEITRKEQQLIETRNKLSLQEEKITFYERNVHQNVNKSVHNAEKENLQKIKGLNKKLQQMLTKLQDTETELDETKARLSKVIGEKLTDNNPNIADLNDRNRPTKLAERYTELYDNQWTEAFDILVKEFRDEEKTVETLLKILQDVAGFCKTKAQDQIEELRQVMEFSKTPSTRDITSSELKILKDCRKAMTGFSVGKLYQMYESYLISTADEALKSTSNVKEFTIGCLEICWYMMVQDPPVSFAKVAEKGTVFNTDLYKAYTRSGTQVEFVVWPPLLLHDTGPVLMKGVAQGYK